MKQDSKRLFSIIIALLFVVAAVVVYFDLIVPAYADLQQTKGQELSEETVYSNEQQIVSEVKKLLTTYQEADSSSTQSVAMALPVGQNVASALAQVYGIGANTGVTIQGTGISVQAVQSPTVDTSNGQLASAAAQGSIIKPTGSISIQIFRIWIIRKF